MDGTNQIKNFSLASSSDATSSVTIELSKSARTQRRYRYDQEHDNTGTFHT